MPRRRKGGFLLPFVIAAVSVLFALLLLYLLFGDKPFGLSKGLLDKLLIDDEPYIELSTQVKVTASYKDDMGIETELAERLTDFFRLTNAAQGDGDCSVLRQIYTDDSTSYAIDREEAAMRYLVSGGAFSADSKLSVTRIAYADSELVEVSVTEARATTFCRAGDNVSYEAEVNHELVLRYTRNGWLVVRHTSDGYVAAQLRAAIERECERDGYLLTDLSAAYLAPYLTRAKEALTGNVPAFTEEGTAVADEQYDRAAAVDYALAWTGTEHVIRNRNSSLEDNGAAFTSQCLAAGGIPLDVQGERFWKYYGGDKDNSRARSGYSSSWSNSAAFLEYAAANGTAPDRFGLVCELGKRAELGDIVQLSCGGEITLQGIIKAKHGGELLVTANSPDIVNYPLSHLPCEAVTLIHIVGYNTAGI